MNLYRTIKEAAGNAIVIGFNTVPHLCTGLCEINRTGDDTSGRHWHRTRNRGVNVLTFHGIQNGTFFTADADCVGIMGRISWELNRKLLLILAESGSPLFVSFKPSEVTEKVAKDLAAAFARNAVQADELVPLDWMENICPRRWLANGKETDFN